MKYKDYYEILGLQRSATAQEIKSAYRKLARKYHPDVNKSADAQAKFKDINEAYEVLGDKDKRQRYDQLGSAWQSGADFTPPPGFEGFNFSNFSQGGFGGSSQGGFSDFFSAIFGDIMNQQAGASSRSRRTSQGGFGGFNSDFNFSGFQNQNPYGNRTYSRTSNNSQSQNAQTQENLDIIQNVILSVNDLITASKKTVTVCAYQQCSVCHGSKQGFCSNCAGSGIEKVTKNITFKIPKNATTGQKIRIKGEGKKDAYGRSGDIYFIIKIEDNDYQIDGDNLIKDIELLPYEAVLGCEKQIETPYGNVKIKFPPKVSSGKKLRIKDMGLAKKDGSKGDFEARVKIIIKDNISKEAFSLYEKLKELNE